MTNIILVCNLFIFVLLLLMFRKLSTTVIDRNTDTTTILAQLDLLIRNHIIVYPEEPIKDACKNIISKDINVYLMTQLLENSFTKTSIVNYIHCRLLENK
jgi:hypothetical protein